MISLLLLTCAAVLREDEPVPAALAAVPAGDALPAVALSGLLMALVTHTAVRVTFTRLARSSLQLREAKPSIAAPVVKVHLLHYNKVIK